MEETSLLSAETITATKRTVYSGAVGDLWAVSVTGTFGYTGTSSICMGASVSAESYVPEWSIINKSSSWNGNRAIGSATARMHKGGMSFDPITETVVLSCDKNGNLS